MANGQLHSILRHLHDMVGAGSAGTLTDGQLLESFVVGRQEAAFEALLRRYGPLVLGVCQRVLGRSPDAEDAFQATFLVLIRKARSLDGSRPLVNFLYTVAYHTALKSRATTLRRRKHETRAVNMPIPTPSTAESWEEIRPLLDGELNRLPEKVRLPLVLCYLEGKTHAEAARLLGWPLGTVKGRLSRGRDLLRLALARRGIALSGMALAVVLSEKAASAGVPAALLAQCLHAWVATAARGVLAKTVATLAEGVLRDMFWNKLKFLLPALLMLGILGTSLIGTGSSEADDRGKPGLDAVVKVAAEDGASGEGNALQTGVARAWLPEKLQEVWSFHTRESIESAPAVAGGVVYCASMDQHLYALDLLTGKEKWRYMGGPFKAAPAVHQGRVYVGDADGLFHCVRAADGTKVWTFQTGGGIFSGANFSDDLVLFGSYDETLYCLRRDGKEQWRFKTQGSINGSPAVAQGRAIVAGCDRSVHVVAIASGKEVRAIEIGGQAGASAAVVGDHVYVGTMTNDVQAVDWKKGQIDWTFSSGQPFFASAAVSGDLVVAGGRDPRPVHALDRGSGKEVWSFVTNGKVDAAPVIVGKRVIAGSLDGKLYVLDLATGKELQKLTLDGPIAGSAAVVEGYLLIGTQKGTLYCLGEKR